MIGTRETFDDLLQEIPEKLRLRVIDLLDSVVFQNERTLDNQTILELIEDLTERVETLEGP